MTTMTMPQSLPSRRTLLRAVAERDGTWDGLFVFGVRTTGIACRPSCPSRRARPEHVEFFPSLADAGTAGFRPCLRCRPDQVVGDPEWWHAAVSLAEARGLNRINDEELARAGIDPVRLRRYARRRHGMTFHAWLRGRRIAGAQRRLRDGEPLDRVIIDSGWDSHSGFRDAFARVAGRAPGRRREAEPIAIEQWHSPLGPLVMAAIDTGICLLEFGDQARIARQAERLHRWFGGPIVADRHPHLDQLREQLVEYFDGTRQEFTVPLVPRGSPFELATWQALQAIPYGETRSYADIAHAIGNPGAVRAVGSANGRNRLAIVIPCHRVVNADGNLGGYGGGLWRKKRLLELER